MSKEKILENARSWVRAELAQEASGHDWWHIVRVVNMAKRLAKEENANLFICELAALLHDMADEKLNSSAQAGLDKVNHWLQGQEVPTEVRNQIMTIIKNMSFKGGQKTEPLSLEGQIVQDADRLDALGAIGIARTMAYSGHKGRLIHDPAKKPRQHLTAEEYRNGQDTAIMHFYEKLLKLKELMNTKTAQRLAQERHAFLETYLEEFYQEWAGDK